MSTTTTTKVPPCLFYVYFKLSSAVIAALHSFPSSFDRLVTPSCYFAKSFKHFDPLGCGVVIIFSDAFMAQIVTQSQETCGMQMLHIHFNNWPVTCGKSCRHVSAAVRVRLYSRGFRNWAEAVIQHEYLHLSPFVLSIFSMHDSGVKVENRQPATPAGR